VVFSNSVIEHLGNWGNMIKMSKEVQRVGKKYFIHTPNRYFPYEPYFLFPAFQYLPDTLKTKIEIQWPFWWYNKRSIHELRGIKRIKLLNSDELLELFAKSLIIGESMIFL